MTRALIFALAIAPAVLAFHHSGRLTSLATKPPSYDTLPTAKYAVNFTREDAPGNSLDALRASVSSSTISEALTSGAGGVRYYTPITVGGQNFKVLVDTGRYGRYFICEYIELNLGVARIRGWLQKVSSALPSTVLQRAQMTVTSPTPTIHRNQPRLWPFRIKTSMSPTVMARSPLYQLDLRPSVLVGSP